MSDLKTVGNYTIRDRVFSKDIRFCWNPACSYMVNTSRSFCLKCNWTSTGPLHANSETPNVRARVKEPTPPKMNKTEARYAAYLEQEKRAGRIADFNWDTIKIRIGPDCFWNVDFLVVDADGHVELHDTKAFWKSKGRVHIEDDARVKMVATASQVLPRFAVVAVWEEDGVWKKKVF